MTAMEMADDRKPDGDGGARTPPLGEEVVMITGASRGLGAALARAFAEAGARVALCARSAAPLRELASSLAAPAEQLHVAAVDVTDAGAVERWVEEVGARLGPPTVLVNNASLLGPRVALVDHPLEAWRRTVETNLHGSFIVAKAVLPAMLARGTRLHHPGLLRRGRRPAQGVGRLLRLEARRGGDGDQPRRGAGGHRCPRQRRGPGGDAHGDAGRRLPGGGPGDARSARGAHTPSSSGSRAMPRPGSRGSGSRRRAGREAAARRRRGAKAERRRGSAPARQPAAAGGPSPAVRVSSSGNTRAPASGAPVVRRWRGGLTVRRSGSGFSPARSGDGGWGTAVAPVGAHHRYDRHQTPEVPTCPHVS
jgi:NAD(P)-dependent dehydrogenase (short-subunit alcohol dehydrogenase family)